MKSCCLQGSLHSSSTPTGLVTALHGLPCYVAEPADGAAPRAIIVYLPDAFGWDMPNNRLLADRYARRTGARVYLPDFMGGAAMPSYLLDTMHTVLEPAESWGAVLWNKGPALLRTVYHVSTRLRPLSDGQCRPRIVSFLSALRAHEARGLKIGVAGFCWGGHHVFDLCAGLTSPSDPSTPLIDAGYTAHPSNIAAPKDFENVRLPICVAIGDEDFAFSKEKCVEGKKVLDAKEDPERYEMRIIPTAKHGFAMRWDEQDGKAMGMAREAEDMAVRFWARWIGTVEREG